MNRNNLFTNDDVISVYTSEQATEDGILYNLSESAVFKNKFFNFVTTNLLIECDIMAYSAKHHGDVIKGSLMLDLLEQAQRIVLNKIRETLSEDHFYCGNIRTSNNQVVRIFISQNETGLYTLMLPSDY